MNQGDVKVVQNIDDKDLEKALEQIGGIGDVTKINCCVAFIVLFFNIILPGSGTMIAGCCMGGLFGKGFICTGVLQLITFPCIVGWVWAIYTGIFFIRASMDPTLWATSMANTNGKM